MKQKKLQNNRNRLTHYFCNRCKFHFYLENQNTKICAICKSSAVYNISKGEEPKNNIFKEIQKTKPLNLWL